MLTLAEALTIQFLKHSPEFRFVGKDRAIAQVMVSRGWLHWNPRLDSVGQCIVTPAGERAYSRYVPAHIELDKP